MNYNKIIKDVAGALTRLQMGSSNCHDVSLINQTIGKLCKDNECLRDELDNTEVALNAQFKENGNLLVNSRQLQDTLKGNEKANAWRRTVVDGLNTTNQELRNAVNKLNKVNLDLRKDISDLDDANTTLLNLIEVKDEEIDSMTSGEDSRSLEELKDIKFCVDHFQLIFPNLFHKLTSMIERHDVPTPKEMTVEEIEKQLGHSIKVVK